jgi:peptidoglycan-associated lipoprotein
MYGIVGALMGCTLAFLSSCGTPVCEQPTAAPKPIEKKEVVEEKPVPKEEVVKASVKEAPPVVEEKPAPVASIGDECNVKEFPMIHFDFDKYYIKPEYRPTLDKIAEVMKKCKNMVITIEGHCDEWGSREYNIALGWKRANEAKKYLVDLGIEENRIKTISYGKEKPICFEHTPSCWRMNRRDEFKVTQ